jgi:glutamate transport system permease protein
MSTDNRLLFDEPGPRARRRIRIATVLSFVVIAGLVFLGISQFASTGQLAPQKWARLLEWPILRFLVVGAFSTVWVAAIAAIIAFPLGAGAALGRLSRTRWVSVPAAGFVELFRAIPMLLVLYVFLFALPAVGVRIPAFWQLVLAMVLSNAAPIAEILRTGVLGLERGQSEAAHSLGLSYWQSMRQVVLPQAVRRVAPALVGQGTRLLKDSTLGYVVSYPELLHQSEALGEYENLVIQVSVAAAACYVLINWLISRLAGRLEGKQQRGFVRSDIPGASVR